MRLLIDPPLDGATNMARDEALLQLHARGEAPATLRLYAWSPACLSLGRFQRAGEIDSVRCEHAGVTVVRRPSGGRALLHDHELTYALVTRVDAALGQGRVAQSYQRISAGLLAGLTRLGAEMKIAQACATANTKGAEQKSTIAACATPSAAKSSAACYDTAAAYELQVDGRKLVGSAQTRFEHALLQHGAIPLTPHAERLCALLRRPPADLEARMVTLEGALGRLPGSAELIEALVAGCAQTWRVPITHGVWAEHELALVEQLRTSKYAQDSWTWGRM
ncbi:MAG: lipoate--protein ligase family protein [Roseiflexaceae bacterium]|nr:lipoate--protein ligase family protein [Roseiflexaceae bacterium]